MSIRDPYIEHFMQQRTKYILRTFIVHNFFDFYIILSSYIYNSFFLPNFRLTFDENIFDLLKCSVYDKRAIINCDGVLKFTRTGN